MCVLLLALIEVIRSFDLEGEDDVSLYACFYVFYLVITTYKCRRDGRLWVYDGLAIVTIEFMHQRMIYNRFVSVFVLVPYVIIDRDLS